MMMSLRFFFFDFLFFSNFLFYFFFFFPFLEILFNDVFGFESKASILWFLDIFALVCY